MDGRRLLPRCVCLAGCLAGLWLAGCGTGADRAQVRAATERFYTAVQSGDGRTACAQLSPDLRAQLVKDESEPTCARAVLKLGLGASRAAAARVYATSAQVELADGDAVFLGDTRLGWRIEALGCKRRGKGPLECEEQA